MVINALKQVTEADLLVVNTRIEGIERSLQLQQSQAMEVITKMAVFEAALKRSDEDIRRIGEKHEKSISDLKVTMENNYNSIFGKLESITDALGLDGTLQSGERLRDNLKKLNKDNLRHEEDWKEIRKGFIGWLVKGTLIVLAGATLLFINQYVRSVVDAGVVPV